VAVDVADVDERDELAFAERGELAGGDHGAVDPHGAL
jgi:hypothetical protein